MLLAIGEVGVDRMLESGLLRDIPYLNTLYTLSTALVTLRDRIFAAKVRRFLLRASELTADERARLAQEVEENPARKAALTEVVLLSLEKADRLKKAELIAILFRAYLRGEISDMEFDRMTHAVNQSDLSVLFAFVEALESDEKHNPRILRIGFEGLISAGITRGTGTPSGDSSGTFTRATELGLKLFQLFRYEKKA